MAQTNPITDKEFAAAMAALGAAPEDGRFAVAVSGGADSMALALLVSRWGPAAYLTFDHGLRPESVREAARVHAWLTGRGLEHHTLVWQGKKPTSNLQALARDARYHALSAWCRERDIKSLILAHTLDDQAETFLIRLFRGSGVDGLAAMAAASGTDPKLLRPLLEIPKDRLVAFLEHERQDWIEDPSNENLEFTRVKVRKLLKESEIEGFDAATLAATAARMARVRGVLDGLTKELLERALAVHEGGYGALKFDLVRAAPDEIGLRALARTLMFFSQNPYPPRLEGLERLYNALRKKDFSGATLHGCRVVPQAGGTILVCRESADVAASAPLKPGQEMLWDSRFTIVMDKGPKDARVAALGEANWRRVAGEHPEIKSVSLPLAARVALPAISSKGSIVAIPHLGFARGGAKVKIAFTPRRALFS